LQLRIIELFRIPVGKALRLGNPLFKQDGIDLKQTHFFDAVLLYITLQLYHILGVKFGITGPQHMEIILRRQANLDNTGVSKKRQQFGSQARRLQAK